MRSDVRVETAGILTRLQSVEKDDSVANKLLADMPNAEGSSLATRVKDIEKAMA